MNLPTWGSKIIYVPECDRIRSIREDLATTEDCMYNWVFSRKRLVHHVLAETGVRAVKGNEIHEGTTYPAVAIVEKTHRSILVAAREEGMRCGPFSKAATRFRAVFIPVPELHVGASVKIAASQVIDLHLMVQVINLY